MICWAFATVTAGLAQWWSKLYHHFFPKRWYIVEGNIGCGKSTLIQQLKMQPEWCEVIDEPVDVWKSITDEHGENILGLFYNDPHRYAYLFQNIVFKTRLMSLEKEQVKPVRVSERSIRTDKHIFSASCFELGYMNVIEKNIYDKWFHWLEQKIPRRPDGIIYLKVAPEICLQRIKTRDRNEESTVSLDYLTHLHQKHETWLNQHRFTSDNVPIFVIDNTGDPLQTLQAATRIIRN